MALPSESEIAERMKSRAKSDLFGFETDEYIPYLSYASAKPFINDNVSEEEFKKYQKPFTREQVLKDMEAYMSFAWDKANNCRGISASRSISHYIAWTWLAGDAELSAEIEKPYEFYGKDHLVAICKHYGWDSSKWDDNRRVNNEED